MNFSINKLIYIKNNIDQYNTYYIDNYLLNNNDNKIYDYFIINKIYYKINNFIKPIFIYVPFFFTLTFVFGFKQLFNL